MKDTYTREEFEDAIGLIDRTAIEARAADAETFSRQELVVAARELGLDQRSIDEVIGQAARPVPTRGRVSTDAPTRPRATDRVEIAEAFPRPGHRGLVPAVAPGVAGRISGRPTIGLWRSWRLSERMKRRALLIALPLMTLVLQQVPLPKAAPVGRAAMPWDQVLADVHGTLTGGAAQAATIVALFIVGGWLLFGGRESTSQ
jgi:type IV secretory pathway VirB2 component (pilin)